MKTRRASRQFDLVFKTIDKLPKGKYKLIDIGSGDKHIKRNLPEHIDYTSLGIEGNPDYFLNLDNKRIPIKDNTFDIVVCLETLEHLLEPHEVMKELLRIGKEDAIFIFSMPNEYNFLLRLYYLLGIKKEQQEPFMVVSKHLHIHSPRKKDIINFFSKYIEIEEIDPAWQSRLSVSNNFWYYVDYIFDFLAKIFPSLFSRLIIIKGGKK